MNPLEFAILYQPSKNSRIPKELHQFYADRKRVRSTFKPHEKLLRSIQIGKCTLNLIEGDITMCDNVLIVNAANENGLGCFQVGHNCVDNAIHKEAGPWLRLEEHQFMTTLQRKLHTSECFETGGYYLPAKRILHVVGPIWSEWTPGYCDQMLARTYENIMNFARGRDVVIPCISSGVFGYPQHRASCVALSTLVKILKTLKKPQAVYIIVYDAINKKTWIDNFDKL